MDALYLRRLAVDIAAMYKEIGELLATPGAVLRCDECGHQVALTPERAAEHTANGWPRHCGRTMARASKEHDEP